MRVLIDGSGLGADGRPGIARYVDRLTRALAASAAPGDEVALGIPLLRVHGYARLQAARRDYPPPVRVAPVALPPALLGPLWTRVGWPSAEWVFPVADVYHATCLVVPPRGRAASIATIYDFYFMKEPSYITPARFRKEAVQSLARADRLIAISDSTARDAAGIVGLPRDRIDVVPLAADPTFRADIPPETIAATRAALGLAGRPYVLYVGTLEPRKDVPTLIRAFAQLRRRAAIPHRLAIAGPRGWGLEPIEATIRRERLGGEDIDLLGTVPQEQIPALIAGADVFAWPTLYEGFGLPLLEAMACGTPVISTMTSSVPEVVGEAGILVGPGQPEPLSVAIEMVVNDRALHDDLSRRGIERAKTFSWERTARETWASYRKAREGFKS